MAAMVLVCIAAVLVIKYLLPRSRFVRRSQGSQIEIVERFTLNRKKFIYPEGGGKTYSRRNTTPH